MLGIDPLDVEFFGVCVESCPKELDEVVTYENSTMEVTSWTTFLDTTEMLFRCLPLESDELTVSDERCVQPEFYTNTTTGENTAKVNPFCTNSKYGSKHKDCMPCIEAMTAAMEPVASMTLMAGMGATVDDAAAEPDFSAECVCATRQVKVSGWRYEEQEDNPLIDQLQGFYAVLSSYFADLQRSAIVIVTYGGVGAFILGFFWVFLLKKYAGVMVWVTVYTVVGAMIACSFILSSKAQLWEPADIVGLLGVDNSTIAAQAEAAVADLQSEVGGEKDDLVMQAASVS